MKISIQILVLYLTFSLMGILLALKGMDSLAFKEAAQKTQIRAAQLSREKAVQIIRKHRQSNDAAFVHGTYQASENIITTF